MNKASYLKSRKVPRVRDLLQGVVPYGLLKSRIVKALRDHPEGLRISQLYLLILPSAVAKEPIRNPRNAVTTQNFSNALDDLVGSSQIVYRKAGFLSLLGMGSRRYYLP